MLTNNSKNSNEFSDYLMQLLNRYVKVQTYFSNAPLYGKIIEVTQQSITISTIYKDDVNPYSSESSVYYLPISAIISVTVI